MPLTTPTTASDVITRMITDVEQSLAAFGGKPALKNSWINALIVAQSNRIFDFYFALDQAALEALPDKAVVNLERWAAIFSIIRTAGTSSTGNVIFNGIQFTSIPVNTVLTTNDGKQYRTVSTVAISQNLGAVIVGSGLTSDGLGTATITTTTAHGLASGVRINVFAATQPEYNVTQAPITVTGEFSFTFPITGTPATPATGAPLYIDTSAKIGVKSVEPGSDQDQIFDTALLMETPIAGVNSVARVDFDEIGGGADRETNAALRARLLNRIQNPIAHFSVADITAKVLSIAGNTRVWVQEITPVVGQVTIYFVRDNDVGGAIPSGSEIATTKTAILTIKPATSDDADVIVLAPTAVPTNFVFSAISPDTASMRAAITASLEELFDERTEVGENVTEDAYRSAIFGTVNPLTGNRIVSFTLSAPPAADIVIAAGELGTLGTVTFT